jgi:hypothetical protein
MALSGHFAGDDECPPMNQSRHSGAGGGRFLAMQGGQRSGPAKSEGCFLYELRLDIRQAQVLLF